MQLHAHFERFRTAAQPSEAQRRLMNSEHVRLRERLASDPTTRNAVLTTLTQGSHRRGTAIRGDSSNPCDVDVVAVTNLPSTSGTADARAIFQPFLERNYPGRYSQRRRSWCIVLAPDVRLDLVPMARPESAAVVDALRGFSRAETLPGDERADDVGPTDWNRALPLLIPDRQFERWEPTHPLLVHQWTAHKNGRCNGRYTQVVRAIKWWWRRTHSSPQALRGYPLEHIIAECCPDGLASVPDGIAGTLRNIGERFRAEAAERRVPVLPARGVPEINVLRRIEAHEFACFFREVGIAAAQAQQATTARTEQLAASQWAVLLGDAIR